jgi:hypothetical protein
MPKIISKKGIVIPAAVLSSLAFFALNLFVGAEKEKSKKEIQLDNELVLLKQHTNSLEMEMKNLKEKLEDTQKSINEQFQEYKVRTNAKLDLISERMYELNARADTADKLGKKNSIWIDSATKELMRRDSTHCYQKTSCLATSAKK